MSSAWIFGILSGILIGRGIAYKDFVLIIVGVLNLTVTLLTSANVFYLGGGA